MNQLPMLNKNAYLTLLIKDNFIYANLAYSDITSQKTYILSDSTDLSPLKFRLDDLSFSKDFWYEYFDSLEKIFDWDIVDRTYEGIFKIKNFEKEEIGVSGIKVIVDDNQPFFKNILISLKEFSNDIALKILDNRQFEVLIEGLVNRLGYNDVIWIDLDISHFSIYRKKNIHTSSSIFSKAASNEIGFSTFKIDWGNEIGLIDFIKSSKIQSFLSSDSSSEDISNKWANLIAHNCEYILDPVLRDLLRAFTTLQLLSIKHQNKERLGDMIGRNTAIFVSGNIPKLLTKRELLFSLIDGLELEGVIDLYIDNENKMLTFGKSMIEKEQSEDIVVFRGDVLPNAFKILIPEVSSQGKNKIIFSGKVSSQNVAERDIYGLGSVLQILKIPQMGEKVIVEGDLKNGAVFSHFTSNRIEFMSSRNTLTFEYLVIDGRHRPIVYGPSAQNNRIKFKVWGDGDKEQDI